MAKTKADEKSVVAEQQPAAETPEPDSASQKPGAVLNAVRVISAELAKRGIGKDKKNEQQGFMFRGIDDIMTVLAPLLVTNNLIIVPRYAGREVREYTSKSGGRMASVSLAGVYRVISTVDSSGLDFGPFYGEGMDSGDKATNKAMSIAFKYFFIQAFVIPIVGNDDPDFEVHEPKGTAAVAKAQQAEVESVEQAIKRLAPTNKTAQKVLAANASKAYSVEHVREIPDDKRTEAIAKLENYVKKQSARAAEKKAA